MIRKTRISADRDADGRRSLASPIFHRFVSHPPDSSFTIDFSKNTMVRQLPRRDSQGVFAHVVR
jgi:hypothetical protein